MHSSIAGAVCAYIGIRKGRVWMNLQNKMKARDAKRSPTEAVLVSVFVMTAVSVVLLLILALILYKAELSESAVKTGIVIIYIISGLIGGFVMGKIRREQKFLWGLAAGVVYFAVLFVVSVLVKGKVDMEWTKAVTTLILCAACGMAGGMIS